MHEPRTGDLSRAQAPLGAGLGYGLAWWLLGPLTLMPLFLGMGFGVNWNAEAVAQTMPSLMGHLIFGAVLGLTYNRLLRRGKPELATTPAAAR